MTKARKVVRTVLLAGLIAAAATAQAKDKQIGSFVIDQSRDPMTDASRAFAVTRGENQKLALAWKCEADGVNVLALWDTYAGQGDIITVQYRFTAAAAVTGYWEMSFSHKSAYMPKSQVTRFTALAISAPSFELRVTDHSGETIADTITLDGLATALEGLPCARSLTLTPS